MNYDIIEYQGSCHYISERNETLPCESWEYDRTYHHSTFVTDASFDSFLINCVVNVILNDFDSGIWCATSDGWQLFYSRFICWAPLQQTPYSVNSQIGILHNR